MKTPEKNVSLSEESIFEEFHSKIHARASQLFSTYFPATFRPDLVNEFIDQSFTILFDNQKSNKILIVNDEGLKIINQLNDNKYPLDVYLLGIIRHSIQNYRKKHQKEINLDLEAVESPIPLDAAIQPEMEINFLIQEVWRQLNPKEAFIFELRILGFSFDEIEERYNAKFAPKLKASNLRQIFHRKIRKVARDLFSR